MIKPPALKKIDKDSDLWKVGESRVLPEQESQKYFGADSYKPRYEAYHRAPQPPKPQRPQRNFSYNYEPRPESKPYENPYYQRAARLTTLEPRLEQRKEYPPRKKDSSYLQPQARSFPAPGQAPPNPGQYYGATVTPYKGGYGKQYNYGTAQYGHPYGQFGGGQFGGGQHGYQGRSNPYLQGRGTLRNR